MEWDKRSVESAWRKTWVVAERYIEVESTGCELRTGLEYGIFVHVGQGEGLKMSNFKMNFET